MSALAARIDTYRAARACCAVMLEALVGDTSVEGQRKAERLRRAMRGYAVMVDEAQTQAWLSQRRVPVQR